MKNQLLMQGRIQGAAVTGVVASVIFATLYSFMLRQFEKEHAKDQDAICDLIDELAMAQVKMKKSSRSEKLPLIQVVPEKADEGGDE